jgi:RES domain-containing protein
MEIFRISLKKHSAKLSASGRANRWNMDGQYVIYAGSSRSLSTLELIVHKGVVKPNASYKVMVLSIADDDYLIKQILIKDLPNNWRQTSAYHTLQKIGSEWYAKQESLMLKVPSAVIPMEFNFIINTIHPKFASKVKLVRTEDYFYDKRLL